MGQRFPESTTFNENMISGVNLILKVVQRYFITDIVSHLCLTCNKQGIGTAHTQIRRHVMRRMIRVYTIGIYRLDYLPYRPRYDYFISVDNQYEIFRAKVCKVILVSLAPRL